MPNKFIFLDSATMWVSKLVSYLIVTQAYIPYTVYGMDYSLIFILSVLNYRLT